MWTQVQQALEDAGYAFIQLEPRLPELRNYRPDLIAWATNGRGELVPWAVVEIKHDSQKPPELSLPQLARYRDLLGTVDHYVVLNGKWFRADDGLRSLQVLDAPRTPQFGSEGELADVGLITSLLASQIRRGTPTDRDGAEFRDAADVIRGAAERGIELAHGAVATVSRSALFEASRRLVESVIARQHRASFITPNPVLAAAMAALGRQKLTGTVVDPFAGVGTLLWASADEAGRRGAAVTLRGREIADSFREIGSAIALTSPVHAIFEPAGDLFEQVASADLVISVPPFGIRMQASSAKSYQLLDGSSARDGDFVVVDMALRSLHPGGRAVLLVPNSFTFRASGERYRQYLAEHYRVAAVIGLDAALQPSTSVSTVLLVIDRAEPGKTFVAQLAGDWDSQLASGGAALEAALLHVESSTAGD